MNFEEIINLVLTNLYGLPAWLAGLTVIIFLLFIFVRKSRRRKQRRRLVDQLINRVYQQLKLNLDITQAANEWLAIMGELIPNTNYFFYQAGPTGTNLTLKAVRLKEQAMSVEVAYTSLLSLPTKRYVPPLNLTNANEEIRELSAGGKYQLFWLDSDDRTLGFVQVGPPLPKIDLALLPLGKELVEAMTRVLVVLLEMEKQRRRLEVAETTSHAASVMSQSSLGGANMLKHLMSMVLFNLRGDAGYLVGGQDNLSLLEAEGLTPAEQAAVASNLTELAAYLKSLEDEPCLKYNRDLQQPPFNLLALPGCQSLVSVPLWANDRFWGLLVVQTRGEVTFNEQLLPSAMILANRMAMSLENQYVCKIITNSYVKTLLALADFDDSLEPSSQGHSRQVAAVARELAREIGLSTEMSEAIWLAGYLHDIGMSGFLRQIASARGRLNEAELAQIRHHARLGAALVEPVQEPMPIAPLIYSHHERWDGWGYPEKLKGEEIPLGARIIAVADFFCAKVTGRSYRSAVSFKQALTEMGKVAGEHLDPQLVKRFITLWQSKARRHGGGATSPGCWEFKQCPEYITKDCPAYRSFQRCWETANVQCARHGDECKTCLVYTYYQYGQELNSRKQNNNR